ncbi:hypothetical protein DERP_011113 [Dermatophagoides pteronyssinus]|uniref:Uncharacterized protein n=1 Tax=Dermatophagoides pteronyssinus TaxID=6956 RepID=A0ABQ8J8U2_DERPT|nr:hypothetical protein DERP_011113 [Dermatophagoides pteronyssinus]
MAVTAHNKRSNRVRRFHHVVVYIDQYYFSEKNRSNMSNQHTPGISQMYQFIRFVKICNLITTQANK